MFENGSTSISREQFFNVKINDESDSSSGDDGLAGVDTIYGDEGDDLIFGDNGIENSVSDKGDIIEGGIGNDVIDGNGGNDTLNGGIDNDIIYGGSGDDIIDGGAGNDSLYGDSGVRYYRAGDLGVFEGKPITFGENLGLSNQIYKNAITDQLTGGNDKITTGPGMDFVDGQGGSDRFIVNLMGESETNYSNITDSGTGEFDKDTLTIEGTEYNDRLLMRRNSKGSLGFVTLLLDEQLIKGEIGNENIERVNFTSSIDVVNLNGNGGDDIITIDGTADTTNVDGGAGDDSFYVLDTIEDSVTHLYGNDGNDSFYNGGSQGDTPYIEVDNIDYKGHSGIVEHTIASNTTNGKYKQTKIPAISVNVRDDDPKSSDGNENNNGPVEVLFVNDDGNIIEPSAIIKEGASAETVYYLKLSRDLKDDETVTVNVYAPSLSEEDIQRGNRGFVFVDGTEEKKTLSVTFTKDDCDKKAVTIKAVGDELIEGNDYFALLHKVESNVETCRPCRNAVLFFKDKYQQTQEYIISDEDDSSEGVSIVLNASRPVESLELRCDDKSIDFKE